MPQAQNGGRRLGQGWGIDICGRLSGASAATLGGHRDPPLHDKPET